MKGIPIVFGSGRWARVYLSVLIKQFKFNRVYLFSRSCFRPSFTTWLFENSFEKCVIRIDQINNIPFTSISFAVIVNRASDHFRSAMLCLSNNCNVAVEKPICLSSYEYFLLSSLSNERRLLLFPLLVFKFHPSLSRLANFIPNLFSGARTSFTLDWHDPPNSTRYGQRVVHDSTIPFHIDVLPHYFHSEHYVPSPI